MSMESSNSMPIMPSPPNPQGSVAFQVQPDGGTNDLQPLVKRFHLHKIWMYFISWLNVPCAGLPTHS